MLKAIQFYIKLVHWFNEQLGKITAWLTTILMLLICFDVMQRYLFNTTSVAFIELEWHLFALIFLFAMGYSLKYDQHVRVDVFYTRFSRKNKAWVNLVGTILFLFPFCLVGIYAAYKYTMVSFGYNEGSPNPSGLPARYLIKAAMMIGFFLLFLQGISLMFESILILIGQENPIEKGVEK